MHDNSANGSDDVQAELEEPFAEPPHLGANARGARGAPTQLLPEHVGGGDQQEAELVRAQVVRDEAAAAADVAERRAEHARAVLPTARSVAERAADRAADTAGDAAFGRTFATGAWVLAVLSLGWTGIASRSFHIVERET